MEVAPPSQMIYAYCDKLDEAIPAITTGDAVDILWSWYATEIPLVLDHVSAVNYEISLDGESLDPAAARLSTIYRAGTDNDFWTVFYALNVGSLAAGEHTITYRATWGEAISDGFSNYGPGTAHPEDTGTCHFSVG
jgi:hypothetical protein